MLIIGAGPAGLTAAFELARHGITGLIVEADEVVGGIARTVERDGYRFDIGGHRFFTKVGEIDKLWDEMLGEPMLLRPRLSRIYYGRKFYDYPLRAANALKNMGLINATACLLSYAKASLFPIKNPTSFEQWVTNQFGTRLYRMFFKSYTEKVWGIPCSEIGADWAAQRIKGLSLGGAIKNALFGPSKGKTVKTLIDEFKYPRLGPGQLWENCAKTVQAKGWVLQFRTRVAGIEREGDRIRVVTLQHGDGTTTQVEPAEVISSMPLRNLVMEMTPTVPDDVLAAANSLKYRDFLTVALVLDAAHLWSDNWVYIHAPEARVGRIQNYKNWSPELVPDPKQTCIGLEYFVNQGDDLWSMEDEELILFAYDELKKLGLAPAPMLKGFVVRMPKAYPVYDTGYANRLQVMRTWLQSHATNLQCVGRNGQHRYNNQDHSMATALIAARKIALGDARDPWAVNEDAEYHEIAQTERLVPTSVKAPT